MAQLRPQIVEHLIRDADPKRLHLQHFQVAYTDGF
jgi:hypothetical protein